MICLHPCSKMLTSLIDHTVIDVVVHAMRNVQQMLLHFINVMQRYD